MCGAATKDFYRSDNIIQSLEKFLPSLERVIPRIVEESGEPALDGVVRIRLIQRSGFLVFIKPATFGFEIQIPVGLILRHIALMRFLLPYWNDHIMPRMPGSPLDEYETHEYYTPLEVQPIFEESASLGDLRTKLTQTRFTRELVDQKHQWEDIEVMSRYALMFLVFHEVAHAVRQHGAFRTLAGANLLTAELSISVSEIYLSTEIVADIFAAQLLTLYFYIFPHAESYARTAELYGPRTGFSVTALFGLFDHRNKTLSSTIGTDYPPSILRNDFFKKYGPDVLQNDLPAQHRWASWTKYGSNQCVKALEKLSADLMMSDKSGPASGQTYYTIGSLIYGLGHSRSTVTQGLADHEALLERFTAWVTAVRERL